MHEQSLLNNLMDRIHQYVAVEGNPLVAVNIELGALAHISAPHLREHFKHSVEGTPLQSVAVNIREIPETDRARARKVFLESLEFEVGDDKRASP